MSAVIGSTPAISKPPLELSLPVTHANGASWCDARGASIQAHGGGILFHEGVYYWYGENRDGPFRQNGEKRRIDAVGVSCYRSTDLLTWAHLGVVLPVTDDSTHDLYPTKVIERPKVIFNRKTGQFVMWLHVDSADYQAARAGIAVADNPAGPFRYLQSIRPNGFMSRDQTLFQDDDGRAYHVCASDDNRTTLISVLSDDYLRPTGEYVKRFADRYMEAQAICKRDGRYWMIASGCTGWAPNEARSATTDDLLGEWEETGNPCVGENSELSFGGQSTFILPPQRPHDPYVAMFDVWRPEDLRHSGYVWLPIDWKNGRMRNAWRAAWRGLLDV